MKKVLKLLLIVYLFVFLFGGLGLGNVLIASADDSLNFDDTYVLDDLISSTVNGEPFDINDYPYKTVSSGEHKDISLVSFVEYCYSFKANMRGNFGLYLYLYNPMALEVNVKSSANRVQMATSYNADGYPDSYEKFDLQFCSVSTSIYNRLFYKFKIIDRADASGKTILDRVNSNQRRYDISGVELSIKGKQNAVDYYIGGTFYFTGYSAGYGPDASESSTLASTVDVLETIELIVHHTYFRTGLSDKGVDHQNQLDSVYFSVDNSFLQNYGGLQKIKAEWWEYRTQPILVTESSVVADGIMPLLGQNITSYNTNLDRSLYYRYRVLPGNPPSINFDWAYNPYSADAAAKGSCLYYLFKVDNIEAYDPRGDKVVVGGVESNRLLNYIKNYNKSYKSGSLPIKNGTVSADLFLSEVDSGRKRGWNEHTFELGVDFQNMPSYSTLNPDFLDKVRDFGFWRTIMGDLPDLDDSYYNVSPIYMVTDADMQLSDGDLSRQLLIRYEDVAGFRDYYAAEKAADRAVHLFRFATTDYFSGALRIDKNDFWGTHWDNEAYLAQETVFLDFDIIELTFYKDGVYTVIPVVSNPIDLVAGITPPVFMPEDGVPWWQMLLMVLILILFLILLLPVLPYIVRFLAAVVSFPFKIAKNLRQKKQPPK